MSEISLVIGGNSYSFEAGVAARLAFNTANCFTRDLVAATLGDRLVDLDLPLTESGTLTPILANSDQGLGVIRHSTAHLLAQAIMRLYPKAKLAIGPTVENGFYYDIDFGADTLFSAEQFPEVEKVMAELVKARQRVERKELSRAEALAMWEPAGEVYKVELINDLPDDAVISTYTQGEFTDLCRGPHVPNTSMLGIFKLMSVAGAYWRGSEKNKMLTRVYGTAWATKDQLRDYLHMLEEAEKRDHRKLAKQLEIFTIAEEVGKGLPLWLPAGTVLRDELEKLAKEKEFLYGYQRVSTPEITKENLYQTSGHLAHYKDSMFPPMKLEDEEEAFYLKPMNCPHHHMIYRHRPRSYREMPVRLAEYGRVYRYEKSGELAGILRVRGMCMNDAHIYCGEETLRDEFKAVMQLHLDHYKLLGLKDYKMRLSFSDPAKDKFVTDPAKWRWAENFCQEVMDELHLPYVIAYGEAAFYGPKVDVQFKNVLGREETNSTNQVDFVAGQRFGLQYIGHDNALHPVTVIHRAPLGTHERFIAFLIEHFAGAFPTWLAPTQVMIIPVAAEFGDYAQRIRDELFGQLVRVEVDNSNDTLNKKIRNAISQRKIPNVLIVGEKERANEAVTLRQFGVKDQTSMSYAEFKSWLFTQIKERKLPERDLA